ncbi:MAG: caspase family protein [Cyanobacteria bacterium P01_E01_bin.42]
MSSLNRRRLLQGAGSFLATLGLNSISFQQKADRHARVLAQGTSRKLALLVGINEYDSQPLNGCLNDIDLQYNLLVHRFGFNPRDILVVTDAEATRTGILTAFEEHLLKQAKSDDVVIYHYSGKGSLAFNPNPITAIDARKDLLSGTFVPVDGDLPSGYRQIGGTVPDIMGQTLFLLLSALKTENVTVVLDNCFVRSRSRCFSGVVRSRDGGQNILISDEESNYQQQLLSRLQMSPEAFIRNYRAGVPQGTVLTAISPAQLARESNIDGFSSGLFTYLITHYLWQENSNIEAIFQKIVSEIPQQFEQTPQYEIKAGNRDRQYNPYFIEIPNPPARGVVTKVQGDIVQLWLGGIDPRTVDAGTMFAGIDGEGRITVTSRNGIVAEAKSDREVKEGMLLHLLEE